MPIEKLLTSISKPAFMRPCVSLSNHRIVYPPSGPMTMAPMNIGMSLPTMTPMAAMAPITPPRSPATLRPAVQAISNGSR